ncbi:zinc finger protein 154-like isoform X2 [Ambystoma mexicanum]|uniref:zinc finger protein 154-like isoform X2 n=1 Tax=Ambystoma mexicanum TaxID=8296 RepID=UPI0037E89875
MKTKKGVLRQEAEKAHITFQDVAACFSEEEWKLLHEWQKEIYSNVMKEIHQALISLGPVIATSVFSLRSKEKDHLLPADNQDSERRHRSNFSISATAYTTDLVISKDEKQYLKAPHETERRENTELNTGFSSICPEIIPKMEHESGINASKMEERSISAYTAVSFHTENDARKPTISFGMYEDEGNSNPVFQDLERRKKKRFSGACPLNIDPGEPFIEHMGTGREHSSTGLSTGVNPSVTSNKPSRGWGKTSMNSECERSFGNKQDANNYHRIKPEETLNACTEYENSTNQESNPLKQKSPNPERTSYAEAECGKSFNDCETTVPHQKSHTSLEMYICSQCGNCFEKSAKKTEYHLSNTGQSQKICNECEQRLLQSTLVNKDQGKYTGGNPYTCRECGKSFRKSQSLIIHQRVHTGEKPYTCSQCGKNFRQLPHLVKHQRLHTGEKPYICNVCERRFIDSSNLKRHEQIHMRELESVTWATEG